MYLKLSINNKTSIFEILNPKNIEGNSSKKAIILNNDSVVKNYLKTTNSFIVKAEHLIQFQNIKGNCNLIIKGSIATINKLPLKNLKQHNLFVLQQIRSANSFLKAFRYCLKHNFGLVIDCTKNNSINWENTNVTPNLGLIYTSSKVNSIKNKQLSKLREKVNSCDYEINKLIVKRIELINEIGEIKKKNQMSVFQPEIFFEKILNQLQFTTKKGLNQLQIIEHYFMLHKIALNIQTQS